MPQFISGPGQGLAYPQNLYPSELQNAPYDSASNQVALAAGDTLTLPAGDWYISLGSYLQLEFNDPVTGIWTPSATPGWGGSIYHVSSDGFNVRVANRLCCPVGAVITNGGGGWVQGSTTISVTGTPAGVAVSTWLPIVGGSLSMNTSTIPAGTGGAGYGIAPIVIIPPPPPGANNPNGVGGVPASGYAAISSGTISGFTFTNPGAGYTGTTFNVIALASPFDPNLTTGITLGTVTFTVGGSGVLTGILCTNPGGPFSNPANITLTVNGVGTNATVSPYLPQTIITASIVGGSTLSTSNSTNTPNALLTSVGGYPPQGSITNSPEWLFLAGRVRPLQAAIALTGAGIMAAGTLTGVSGLYDSGYFYQAPTAILNTLPAWGGTGTVVGSSSIVFTMGSKPDICRIQPAP